MRSLSLALVFCLSTLSASAKNLYIPAAAHVAGANGTFYRTDVRIFNPSYVDDISVSVHFLPTGMDGSNISGRLVSVPHRQMVVLNDIVGTFFSLPAGNWLGAIRLDSDTDKSYELIAESRTYTDNPSGGPGTYGQYIPALDPAKSAAEKTVVLHVTQNAAFRTNSGVMNPSREPVVVTPSFVSFDNTLIAEGAPITIPPMSMIQRSIPQLFDTTREVADGFILFDATAPLFTWASVVDNTSGDAIFVQGMEDTALP